MNTTHTAAKNCNNRTSSRGLDLIFRTNIACLFVPRQSDWFVLLNRCNSPTHLRAMLDVSCLLPWRMFEQITKKLHAELEMFTLRCVAASTGQVGPTIQKEGVDDWSLNKKPETVPPPLWPTPPNTVVCSVLISKIYTIHVLVIL